MQRYTEIERLGVNATEKIFIADLKMIFREQPIVDMGVDAHVEFVEDGQPMGKLLGVQIKTGESHFQVFDDHLVFYGNNTHLAYWLAHSLPIILIAHLPEKGKTYWQHISKSTITHTPKAWKVKIPFSQELTIMSKDKLLDISGGTPEQQRLNKLFFDKELMQHLANGGKINLSTEEWLHKSLGRGTFEVILIDKGGKEEVVRNWAAYYTYTIPQVLRHYFPWADFENDTDFFNLYFDEDSVSSMYGESYFQNNKLFPYEVVDSEAGLYRINLTLNETGKAFLALQAYLAGNELFR